MENSGVLLLSRLTLAQVDSPKLTVVSAHEAFNSHLENTSGLEGRIREDTTESWLVVIK